MNPYSIKIKEKVVNLFHDGTPVSQLTTDTGISQGTIYRWIKEAQMEKNDDDDCTPTNYYMLKRKYEKLKNIVEILQKVDCKPTDPLSVKLPEMEALYGQYSTHTICDALCVPRGTYYNYVRRRKKESKWYEVRREEYRERIRQIYDKSNQVFGPQKICAVLQEQGYATSVRYVRSLMNEMNLISIRQGAKGSFEREQRKFENRVNRQFNPQRPNEVWVSDITYFRFNDRYYYICVILDLFSRRVLAHRISVTNSTQLTKKTLKLAYESRKPDDALIFHSDRGSNYCSKTFCDYLRTLNITQSFSKPHTPHDNAVMESFFSNMKREALYRTAYRSEREFRKAVEQYIIFYNEERPHHHNSYKTPAKCESMYFQKLAAVCG